MRFKHAFIVAFALCAGMISYQDITKCHDLPFPPRLIGAAITFGMLDLFSFLSEELASIMALGITLGFFINTIHPPAAQKGSGGFLPGAFAANCDCRCSSTPRPATFSDYIEGNSPSQQPNTNPQQQAPGTFTV